MNLVKIVKIDYKVWLQTIWKNIVWRNKAKNFIVQCSCYHSFLGEISKIKLTYNSNYSKLYFYEKKMF